MSELRIRIGTAIVFAIVFLVCILINPLTYILFFGLMIFGSSREFHRLHHIYTGQRVRRRGTLISGFIALLPFFATCYAEYYLETHIWELYPIIISMFIVIFLTFDIYSKKDPILLRMPFWLAMIIYPSFLVSVVTMTVFASDGTYLKSFVLMIMICTWAVDVGAYFVGRAVGKRKLAPSVSPNKTIEGAMGGVVLSGIVGLVLSAILGYTYTLGIILGLSCGFWGIFGDLMESKMKRTANVKDSGSFMPGHGGFLDRFDGFTFNLPFASMIIWLYLHYNL